MYIYRKVIKQIVVIIEENLWSITKWRWILENENGLRVERPNKNADSEIRKKQKSDLAGSCDADGRKKNAYKLEWKPTGRRNRGRQRKR